jgi:predicted nucleic acid-binding protein
MTLWQSSLQAFALSMGGMTALAFAMDRHYAQLTSLDEVPTAHRMALRVLGALLLLAVCLPAMRGWSATVGSVLVLGF